jgi:hypothetical protein
MDKERAKEILMLYRPGIADADDAEMAEALKLAKGDAELGRWLEEYCALQQVIRTKFRETTVPEGLLEQIVSERKAAIRSRSLRRTMTLAMAAAAVLGLLAVAKFYSPAPKIAEDNSFSGFRYWAAGQVIRYPKMDLETNDLAPIRQMVESAEGTYTLPKGLEATKPTGCATNLPPWNGSHRVAMICFNSGKPSDPTEPDLFLFITDRSAVPGAPPTNSPPQLAKISRLMTVSWSDGDKTYVLGGRGDEESLRKYF